MGVGKQESKQGGKGWEGVGGVGVDGRETQRESF